jgi:fatty-acyl-CoA synthase
MFVDGQLYVTGRIVDLLHLHGRTLYPQEIEATVADAAELVRRGYVVAVSAPVQRAGGGNHAGEQLVILAERATGTSRTDPGPAIEAIGAAVSARHGVRPAEVVILPAGSIPRTTSGKLARRACRAQYLAGSLKGQHR